MNGISALIIEATGSNPPAPPPVPFTKGRHSKEMAECELGGSAYQTLNLLAP